MDAEDTSGHSDLRVQDETAEICENFQKCSLSASMNDLPLEVWLAIGRFVPPEDVLTFCLICRRSYEATHRPLFWIRLYKRHRPPPLCCKGLLSQDLTYRGIKTGKGLRAKVIRALYRMYPLFGRIPFKLLENGDFLVGRRCCGLWARTEVSTICRNKRNLYLKLEDVEGRESRHMFHALKANYEANMKILVIEGFENQTFPPIKNLVLRKMLIRRVHADSKKKGDEIVAENSEVTLHFDGECRESVTITVRSDRCHKFIVSVLDWWDIRYPYPYLRYAKERAMKRRIHMGKLPHKVRTDISWMFGNEDDDHDDDYYW
ncbi:transmembrane protein 183A-like [Corticium candelabrum]|uniref:transmembrane protein 183A-like n=1 Tax=Corticium candelabrum TaxID=121492 RepID=UPI002E26B962|nr:transmembrane protein 183A-like [Corticium candelabrum]